MKKIGLIGVGNISKKAYMPIIQGLVETQWVLYSREKTTLEKLKHTYRIAEGYTSIEELINSGVDACFVQSPTPTHYEIIKQLLSSGVSVFVDKPVSEKIQETTELFQLAKEKDCILFVGFNRRYAPKISKAKQMLEGEFHLTSVKNRINKPQPVVFAMYDLFIHPLDTCLFFMQAQDVEIVSVDAFIKNNMLHYVSVQLKDDHHHATVSMNLMSGANRELLEVGSSLRTQVIENLEHETIYTSEGQQALPFSDWDTTLYKRGFEPMIKDFLLSLEQGELSSQQTNTLVTHQLLDEICQKLIK